MGTHSLHPPHPGILGKKRSFEPFSKIYIAMDSHRDVASQNCWINRAGEELLWETRLFQGDELQDDPDKTAKVPQAPITTLREELTLLDREAFPFPTMTTPHTALHGFPLSICHCFRYYTLCPHKALLKALQTPNPPVPSSSPSHRGANTSQSSWKGQELLGEQNTLGASMVT